MTIPTSYTSVAKALHWLIAIMIIVQIPAGIIMHKMDPSQTKFLFYQLHKSFGLVILALALFRLYWRLTHKAPPLPDSMATWEKVAARITHVLFYVAIIGIPLVGWLMVSASTTGIPTKLFFVIPVPHLPVPQSKELADAFAETHEYMAFATIGLFVLHVAAALKHHYKDHDGVLQRMLPSALGGKERTMAAADGEASFPSTRGGAR
ncbi:MAG: cytochrome b [Parvularcula sp.]|nr:cytochrome b [Parvularcula sp.]